MINRLHFMVLGIVVTGLLNGCQSYFMVQDPAGTKTYYTDHISEEDSGAIRFKDLQTGAKVTLQSSVVKQVSRDDLPPGLVR
jgi:hypothetical protein